MISVVVPVYNVEKYINDCIDSIINQTYRELEIILVDDGSNDSSGAICDEYAMKDDRIRVIHKKNGGLAEARNKGIDSANGSYLAFIDSDDHINVHMMDILLNNLIKTDSDISVCRFHKYNEGLYRKDMLLYSDGRILQPVYKKDRKLLKIIDVK